MTEAELLHAVVEMARAFKWRVHHCRPGRTDKGWRTPIQGDPGFPDLVLAREGEVLFVELKNDKGRISPAQKAWLASLPWSSRVWRPAALRDGTIERVLR